MIPRPTRENLLLLGAGHAHVEVLRRHARRPIQGARLTLVTREPRTPYSGMLPGVIRGDYSAAEAEIDCARLAAAADARLILGAATAIDPLTKQVCVAGHPPVAFDLLSVDVGGEPLRPNDAGGIPVKPIGGFLARLATLEAELPAGARIAVIGGGPGGVELALALARRGRSRIAVVTRDADILPGVPRSARAHVSQALERAEIAVVTGAAALRHCGNKLVCVDAGLIEANAALWATGAVAPAFLAASGLACDADGCVRVEPTLRSVSHDCVFAAGDCAALDGNPRPKAGVWAVRAGAPLTENLRRAVAGAPLLPWTPQRDALVILGLGDGRAVAWRGGTFLLAGRLAWWWKDSVDRRWMRRYQNL